MEIQVEPPAIEGVLERLAKLPDIYFLGACTGAFDIIAVAVFRSNEDLYAFLTKRLNLIPGITRTCTSSIVRVVRREFRFGLGDDSPAVPGEGDRSGAARGPTVVTRSSARKRGHD